MEATDPILIGKVRDKLLDDCKSHPELYDDCDMDRVRDNDWTVQRFLLVAKLDVETAFVALRDCMRWRKSFGVNHRTDLDYPTEFFKIGIFFPYSVDKTGKVVVYLRVKMYKSFPRFSDYFKEFIIHILNKIDLQTGESGWAMVWDLTGAGPSNWDLSMVRFIITSLRSYFPRACSYIMLYGVPWIMNPFINIALKIMPEESRNKVKNVYKDEIFNFIDPQNLPDFLNGKCTKNYRELPKGVRDAKDIAIERGYTNEEIDNVLKFYNKYLIES